jgi:hypothetical protein
MQTILNSLTTSLAKALSSEAVTVCALPTSALLITLSALALPICTAVGCVNTPLGMTTQACGLVARARSSNAT